MRNSNKYETTWHFDFGTNLQRMLHRKGITQGMLANKLGTTDAMISRYIRGIVTPSVYRVCQIAEILECDISDLIKTKYDL